MLRLVTLLVAIQAIAVHSGCHHNNRCNRRYHNYRSGSHANDGDFHDLSWTVVRADRKAQNVCHEDSSHTTDTFYSTHYEISVPLPDFTEEQISVKLKHRVLFIQAIKGTEKLFSELKIIPEFAKGKDASWIFENNLLNIYVPYGVTLGTEVAKSCNKTIDETLITLPKAGIDARFGDDSTTEEPFTENVV